MKNLVQYIQGSRKGKDAHRLEKEAMKDPFLSDALDGFQAVEGNHVESIEEMRRRISRRTRSHRNSITKWSIAASLLICLGFGSYFWLNRQLGMPSQSPLAVVMEEQAAPLQQAPLAGIAADSMQEQENANASGAGEVKAKVFEDTPQPPVPAVAEAFVAQVEVYSAPCEDVAVVDIIAEEEAPVVANALARSMPQQMPQPVIGEKAYREYLKKELIHPQDSLCKGVSGTVVVEFHINEKGRPVDLKVKRSLCESADKEALRLIEKGPDWEVDTVKVSIPVVFAP